MSRAMEKVVSNNDIRRMQQLLFEARNPFIQLLVDLYSLVVPAIVVQDNAIVDIIYPDWLKEQEGKIRAQMAEVEDRIISEAGR